MLCLQGCCTLLFGCQRRLQRNHLPLMSLLVGSHLFVTLYLGLPLRHL